jgi:dTMP kinase
MGKLISLSGLDGSGKTTLGHLLQERLISKGFTVTLIESGPLRAWTLLELLKTEVNLNAESVTADRIGVALNLERLAFVLDHVKPACSIYDFVILSRYVLDWAAVGRAFGAGAHEIDLMRGMIKLVDISTSMVYINVPPDIAKKRLISRGQSLDVRETAPYLEKIALAYKSIIDEIKLPFIVMDGNLSPQNLVYELLKYIES